MVSVKTVRFEFKHGSCLLTVPDETIIRDEYEKAMANGKQPAFPYWARVWPSAVALTRLLDQYIGLIEGKTVLEIAAGLGLPSMYAARFSKLSRVTDYAPDAVEMIKASIESNGWQHAEAIVYNWHESTAAWPADVVLMSDTNYAPGDLVAIDKLIRHYISNGSIVVLSTPNRIIASEFLSALNVFCQFQESMDIENNSISLYVFATAKSAIFN